MATLRRRGTADTLSGELEQPLLGGTGRQAEDGAAIAPLLGQPKPLERRWPLFLGALAQALAAAWQYLLGLLRRLLPGGRRQSAPPQLSPLEAARLSQLRCRAAVPYNAEEEEHQVALQGLWEVVYPDSPFPPGIKHPQWKAMGWQSENPGTDFRGGGFLSLEALLWAAQQRRATFLLLMRKENGQRSDWEYPFCAGGVNIVHMLTEVLDLRRPGDAPPATQAAAGFLPLLAGSGAAFEEVFLLSCRLLDHVWLQAGASYMEFPQVMRDVRLRLERCLASGRACTVQELEQLLLPQQAPSLRDPRLVDVQ